MLEPNELQIPNGVNNHQSETSNADQHYQADAASFLAKVTVDIVQPADDKRENGKNSEQLLFVEQNDVVAIERRLDERWFLAKSEQQVGRLAADSCHQLDDEIPLTLCQYLVENQFYHLHVCFASFVAQDVGDLSLTKGDIIVAINQVNEHWMQGQVCFDSQANKWPKLQLGQQLGSFPLNHCWQLDSERVSQFCRRKLEHSKQQQSGPPVKPLVTTTSSWVVPSVPRKPLLSAAHSSSLSSGSSSLYSTDFHQAEHRQQATANNYHFTNHHQQQQNHDTLDSRSQQQPPPRPKQLPQQILANQKASSEQQVSKPNSGSILSLKQQDKLKGWLHTVKKKTARLSTKITASLGLISLTRDEEFERHYDSFKHLEKTIRVFIKNLSTFVEHFESFLLALQNTSDNLADFYRDKAHQREFMELKRKNKALACEHFHAFKRTIDRQVIAVASQLLQKFSGPRQLINKRSAKLLDYDTKTKEMETCRDLQKKAALRDHYVIAKDIYERINGQLIEELPQFNQFALDIFRECILVLLESRRTLILSYTKQTASLLETPLMASYTASEVASTIMMSAEETMKVAAGQQSNGTGSRAGSASGFVVGLGAGVASTSSRQTSDHAGSQQQTSRPSSAFDDDFISRPHSVASQLSSDFDHQIAIAAREISSTPLSHVNESQHDISQGAGDKVDQNGDVIGVRFVDEPDGPLEPTNGVSDNQQNEDIEAAARTITNHLMNAQSAARDENHDKSQRRRKYPIYIASWPFEATGPNQLTIVCNQALKLVKGCDECGNSEWSLVRNKRGQVGYVPTSYIKPRD